MRPLYVGCQCREQDHCYPQLFLERAPCLSQIMDGMVSKNRTVDGVPTSLCDLGYCDVGLDDNWQLCGSYGPQNYTYHDENGAPVINTTSFPDMKQMVDYAHELGLTAGWYGNNCICRDHCGSDRQHNEDDDTCYKVRKAQLLKGRVTR